MLSHKRDAKMKKILDAVPGLQELTQPPEYERHTNRWLPLKVKYALQQQYKLSVPKAQRRQGLAKI